MAYDVPTGHAPATAPGMAAFFRAVARVEEVVDQETECLRLRRGADLDDFNQRKSLGMLELSRAMRALDRSGQDEVIAARLRALRARLEENRAALGVHLRAAQEISEIIAGAIQDAQSDGTYSVAIGSTGRAR
ncbi:flagellar protein FlgN [Faunimonas sp. B44]|uniref:flagellar protein FlgN n=1 Tax=Faunimonas sp. B44 TaxID=3461493 RepID=UPI004044F590